MTEGHPVQLEKQLEVVPTDSDDVFTHRYDPWGHHMLLNIAGSVLISQSALAAYQTIPQLFSLHSAHSRFLAAALKGVPVEYVVQRTTTTSRTACRIVRVEQKGSTKVLCIFNFIGAAPEDKAPQPFDHIPQPSKETVEAASTPIDWGLDDAHKNLYGIMLEKPPGWPANTSYPAISNTRLSVSNRDKEVSQRVYRFKLRTLYPNSSPKAQLIATLFFSDFYVLDTPLTVQDIRWGESVIGSRSSELTQTRMKVLSSLCHTLHFCATDEFDVQEGILIEAVTKWAKGRRAAIGFTIWDTKGKLIATGEQEGYFIFNKTSKI